MDYVRVINIEQPVETHVHTQRNVNQVFMLLLQAVVDGRQAVDDLWHRHQLAVIGQLMLYKSILSHAQVQKVHWKE